MKKYLTTSQRDGACSAPSLLHSMGDAAYGTADNLDFLLAHNLHFVIKGRNYTSFKGVEAYIPITDWEYVNSTTFVYKKTPRPTADFIAPALTVPAAVTPR